MSNGQWRRVSERKRNELRYKDCLAEVARLEKEIQDLKGQVFRQKLDLETLGNLIAEQDDTPWYRRRKPITVERIEAKRNELLAYLKAKIAEQKAEKQESREAPPEAEEEGEAA